MKFCDKHQQLIEKLSVQKRNYVFSTFIDRMVGPDIDIQDRIHTRKDQCPVCYFRKDGIDTLKKIIKENGKKKILA